MQTVFEPYTGRAYAEQYFLKRVETACYITGNIIKYCKCRDKIEMLVQGSVEVMKTRYPLLYRNELNRNYQNYLIDTNNNKHSIHKSISGEELTIFSDSELCLINEIKHLNDIGYSNFSIDGRYKDDSYIKMIDIYKNALNGNINEKELKKISSKNTIGNY